MEISTSSNVVTITGNIKAITDYQKIKSVLDVVVQNSKSVTIEMKDSISVISSVIGYLTKLVQKDGINLSVRVGDAGLMDLFEDLNLVPLFQVKKI